MSEEKSSYVVEYSLDQDAWHVEELQTALRQNLLWCSEGPLGNDYKIVAIADGYEAANKLVYVLRKQVDEARSCFADLIFHSTTGDGAEQPAMLHLHQVTLSIRTSPDKDPVEVIVYRSFCKFGVAPLHAERRVAMVYP